MRVLLTGATGLIGRETATALADRGAQVIALSRSGASVSGAAEALAADLLEPRSMRQAVGDARAECLVHLAWYDGPNRMGAEENRAWVTGTVDLVRAFADAGGRRAVVAGSCAEYDWTARGPFRESDVANPQSIYGAAKLETYRRLGDLSPELGLTLCWPRIFFVYGAGEPEGRLLGDLVSNLRGGRPSGCTDGKQIRDFLSAADVGRALAHLAFGDAEGPVNIASGAPIAVRDLIETAAEILGRPDLVRLGARSRPEDDPNRLEADITRLAGLGFRPRFGLQDGLADAISRTA